MHDDWETLFIQCGDIIFSLSISRFNWIHCSRYINTALASSNPSIFNWFVATQLKTRHMLGPASRFNSDTKLRAFRHTQHHYFLSLTTNININIFLPSKYLWNEFSLNWFSTLKIYIYVCSCILMNIFYRAQIHGWWLEGKGLRI